MTGPIGVRTIVRAGLITGAIALYIALVGLLERFEDLNIVGEQLTFSRVVLVLPPVLAGFLLARPRVIAGERREATPGAAVLAGGAGGLIAMAVLGVALWWLDTFGVERVRPIFVTASPALIEFLTFAEDPDSVSIARGIAILLGLGALAGALGGALRSLDPRMRRPLVVGLASVVLAGLLQRIVPIALDQLDVERDWLYSRVTRGLTLVGGILVFAVAAGASVLWTRRGQQTRDRIRSSADERPVVRL
ncbi:MAG TPA: hypothetical protein VEC09_04260, partial [Actinomycetota bacterium]|nr:hypothetical protein [Actinomycetota bacterium]